jgi:isopentenyl-diphosphate delta-isomerase
MTTDHRDAVVSSDDEELILVDLDDRELGFETKDRCHDGDGILHRAFSVFLRDADGRILLQQRASGKRLWAGFWANTVCSHPRRGESMELATKRRMQQELGVVVDVEFCFKFDYHARFGDLGSERELCWVYLGTLPADAEVTFNRTEIDAVRWVSPEELDRELTEQPRHFTPWLHLEWEKLRDRLLPSAS